MITIRSALKGVGGTYICKTQGLGFCYVMVVGVDESDVRWLDSIGPGSEALVGRLFRCI